MGNPCAGFRRAEQRASAPSSRPLPQKLRDKSTRRTRVVREWPLASARNLALAKVERILGVRCALQHTDASANRAHAPPHDLQSSACPAAPKRSSRRQAEGGDRVRPISSGCCPMATFAARTALGSARRLGERAQGWDLLLEAYGQRF